MGQTIQYLPLSKHSVAPNSKSYIHILLFNRFALYAFDSFHLNVRFQNRNRNKSMCLVQGYDQRELRAHLLYSVY